MGFEGWSLNDLIEYSDNCKARMKATVKEYIGWKKKKDEADREIRKRTSGGDVG